MRRAKLSITRDAWVFLICFLFASPGIVHAQASEEANRILHGLDRVSHQIARRSMMNARRASTVVVVRPVRSRVLCGDGGSIVSRGRLKLKKRRSGFRLSVRGKGEFKDCGGYSGKVRFRLSGQTQKRKYRVGAHWQGELASVQCPLNLFAPVAGILQIDSQLSLEGTRRLREPSLEVSGRVQLECDGVGGLSCNYDTASFTAGSSAEVEIQSERYCLEFVIE